MQHSRPKACRPNRTTRITIAAVPQRADWKSANQTRQQMNGKQLKTANKMTIKDNLDNLLAQRVALDTNFASRLRKSILQEAIQGRLVPQDPSDEPASALLERIREEKKRLVKEGKLKKKDLEVKPIEEDEIPFEIPESWEWCRLHDISKTITKGTTPRGGNVAYSSSGIGFLRAENVGGFDKLDLSRLKYVTEEEHTGFLSRSIIESDDILITIAGTLGRTALVKEKHLPLNANQAVSIVRLVDTELVFLLFIIYALNEPNIQKAMSTQKKVTAIPNLTLEIINDCIIPFPPLAEQRRIVAKIEELFGVIK
jgi:type I restriction enzyme S subunit